MEPLSLEWNGKSQSELLDSAVAFGRIGKPGEGIGAPMQPSLICCGVVSIDGTLWVSGIFV